MSKSRTNSSRIEKKRRSIPYRIAIITLIIVLINLLISLIGLIKTINDTRQPHSNRIIIDISGKARIIVDRKEECGLTLDESQIRLRIDTDLQKRNLDSAIKMLLCLEKYEKAHREESVRIIGWCVRNDKQCEYLKRAAEVADRIKNDDIRFEQREIISLERLKKDCI